MLDTIRKTIVEHKIFVAIFLLAAIIIFFQINLVDIIGDDSHYSSRAIGLVDFMFGDKQPTPLNIFDHYPWWANFSYHDHPPLLFLIQHLFLKINPNSFFSKLPYALFSLATLLFTYLIVTKKHNKNTASLTAILLALNNLFIWSARSAYLEAGAVFFIIISIYFFNKFIKNQKYWPLLGISIGLTLITKYTTFFIIPSFLTYLIIFKRDIFKKHYLYLAIAISILIFSPVIIYNAGMFSALGHFDLEFSAVFNQNNPWQFDRNLNHNYLTSLWGTVKSMANTMSWPLISLSIISIIYSIIKAKNKLILILLLFLTLQFVIISPTERYMPLYAPFLSIVLAVFLYDLYKLIKSKYLIITSKCCLFLLLIYLAFFSFNNQIFAKKIETYTGWLSSPLKSNNYGNSQLDQYLNQLVKNKYITNKIGAGLIDSTQLQNMRQKQKRLQKYSQIQPNTKNLEEFKAIIVTDQNINWFSKVWLFEKRIFYQNIPLINPTNLYSFYQQGVDIEEFYFIKATEYAKLKSSKYISDNMSDKYESVFKAKDIKPETTIYRLDGQPAFKIYHYQASKHGQFF